jgi:hypothetical protein
MNELKQIEIIATAQADIEVSTYDWSTAQSNIISAQRWLEVQPEQDPDKLYGKLTNIID